MGWIYNVVLRTVSTLGLIEAHFANRWPFSWCWSSHSPGFVSASFLSSGLSNRIVRLAFSLDSGRSERLVWA